MGEKIFVYNTEITLPDEPDISEIENWGTNNPEEQYWRRKSLPNIFKTLVYDTDGNIVLTPEQEAFCLKELDKIHNGCWVMINGKATFLPYNYYYYLQYWTLENKKPPEYRDVSRRYALFRWHWKNVYWCIGILRGKGRRTGATSEITSNIVCEVTTNKNRRGGIISKTGKDARKIFLYRVQFGFRHLPFFLQPTLENDKDSKTELVFNVPISKTKKNKTVSLIDEVEGINSMIDYQAPGLNTYDQERLTDLLLDEGGKLESDVPFSEFLSIISECLVEGGEKVGFAEMPSTVNKWAKGGEEFKKAWDGATWVVNRDIEGNEEEKDEDEDENDEETANKFVRYYCPSYDGLPGFIGKFGESIIDAPTESQAKYLIAKWGLQKYNGRYKYGAKVFLERKRKKLTGAALEEEIRKYSFNEIEMFMSANAGCIFNIFNITQREEYLRENPVHKRRIIFWRDLDQKIKWRDIKENEADFHWEITKLLSPEESNKYELEGRLHKPSNTHIGAITVDGYGNSQGGRKYGSKACAWIGLKYNLLDPNNSFKAIGRLYGRPSEKSKLHEQVMMAAEYYGFQSWFEHNSDEYDNYFKDRGKRLYLGIYPLSTIPPDKKETTERHRGFPTTPFSLTRQNDVAIAYFENYCHLIDWLSLLDNSKKYDPYNRTAFDEVVSFEMLIVCLMEPVHKPPPQKKPLIRIFDNSGNEIHEQV